MPDEGLVRRHEREIFSLMKKRHLFSQVTNFELYDLYDQHGNVNENVFAYSNSVENDRSLVVYHNTFAECRGWIRQSCVKAVSVEGVTEKQMRTRSIAEALGFRNADEWFYLFKEQKTGLEYIRSGKEIHANGFYIELQAFEYKLFLNFQEVYDSSNEYRALADSLQGKGVPDIPQLLKELRLKPVHESIADLISKTSEFLTSKKELKPDSIA